MVGRSFWHSEGWGVKLLSTADLRRLGDGHDWCKKAAHE